MPTIDGGHYFLTALAPILTDPCRRADKTITSPLIRLREELARLPTAEQSAACIKDGRESPFTRNLRNHFVRFAVIDNVAFNGRLAVNAIRTALRGPNPAIPQEADCLLRPYLFFSADFDAPSGKDSDLDDYLTDLWTTMADELRAVFSNCVGFDETVRDAQSFCAYIRRCQIETTMPFNDYWTVPPPFAGLELGALKTRAIAAGAASFAAVGLILWAAFGNPWIAGLLGLAVGAAGGLFYTYRTAVTRGSKRFPTAPNSDLRSVLKALYLQRAFTRFAIDMQGADPARLHAEFGGFLRRHRPDDLSDATQRPGIVPL